MRTKLLVGCLVLFCAVAISAVAAYFSVVGLAALFAAAFIPVCIMGVVLEGSKLVSAGWLHANWKNPNVGGIHKSYLVAAICVLMAITSMGIYGYLARAHLEQKAPTAAVQIDIDQKQTQIDQLVAQRDQLLTQQKVLNETVSSYLGKGSASGASQFLRQQRGQQASLQGQIAAVNQQITAANVALAPLKKDVAGAEAELGPLKYIAKALGMKDPEAAVNLVIVMLMFAFDPLAIVLMISATITIGEWQRERRRLPEIVEPEIIPPTEPDAADVDVFVQLDETTEHLNRKMEAFKEDNSEAGPEAVPEPPQEAPEMPQDVDPDPALSPTTTAPPPSLWTIPTAERSIFDIKVDPYVTLSQAPPVPEEPRPDAKAQLVDILEKRPELLEELVEAVESVRREREEAEIAEPSAPPPDVPWLDPK